MAKRVLAGVLAAAMIMSTASSAAAQDQTPENAHKFLEQVFAQGGVMAHMGTSAGYNQVRVGYFSCHREMVFAGSDLMPAQYDDVCGNDQYFDWEAPAYTNVKYKSTARCYGGFTGDAPSYTLSWKEGNTTYRRGVLGPFSSGIGFGNVAEVKATDTRVWVTEGSYKFIFHMPSAALATRVAFAMEFLRASCDPTASTGF